MRRPNRRSYAEWLEQHIAERAKAFRAPATPADFALLTTVYEKTDPALLRVTAGSVLGQSLPCAQWIILAHGAISRALRELLAELARNARVTIYEHPQNLGIVRGMRLCLEAARASYVIPLDADDVLTPDALQILACVLAPEPRPVFAYSDEDLLINETPTHPYWRPQWDEILNLETSYIWHLCAFHRERALALGVYSDSGTDWCHDWDTVTRFANAGHVPRHVPEVLYHWRQHAASSTNRPGPNPDSLRSTHHLLLGQLARQADPAHFELAFFPINRGVPEWYIARRRISPLRADLVVLVSQVERTRALLDSLRSVDYRPACITLCTASAGLNSTVAHCARELCEDVRHIPTDGPAGLIAALHTPGPSFVWLCSDSILFEDDHAPWEAIRLMELHPRAKIVCGRLVDVNGKIADAGAVLSSSGKADCLWKGWTETDPGPYALALKPHTVEIPTPDLFFAERAFLLSALRDLPLPSTMTALAQHLGSATGAADSAVAYSPLIRARAVAPLLAQLDHGAQSQMHARYQASASSRSSARDRSMLKLYS